MSLKKKKTVWGLSIILKNIKEPGLAGFKIKLFISNIAREQRLLK